MIIAVDFDNTLALGIPRYISAAKPNRPLIERLRAAKEAGAYIKVVTARGAKAGLTQDQRAAMYGETIGAWLKKHGVPHDEISFLKEYAELYIDDQAKSPDAAFEVIKSDFTGNLVLLTDDTAIKCAPTAAMEFEWYRAAALIGLTVPDVLFANETTIITRRIRQYERPIAFDFIEICERMKAKPPSREHDNPFSTYIENIVIPDDASEKTRSVIADLPAHPATFFHGDLSTTNVLCASEPSWFGERWVPYLIDPNCKHIFGSYLTDAGKAAFSLIAYEAQFDEAQKIADHFGPHVWRFAVAEGLRVCKYKPGYISHVNNIADLI